MQAAAVSRHHISFGWVRARIPEDDLASVRRPARQNGLNWRLGQLHRMASIPVSLPSVPSGYETYATYRPSLEKETPARRSREDMVRIAPPSRRSAIVRHGMIYRMRRSSSPSLLGASGPQSIGPLVSCQARAADAEAAHVAHRGPRSPPAPIATGNIQEQEQLRRKSSGRSIAGLWSSIQATTRAGWRHSPRSPTVESPSW